MKAVILAAGVGSRLRELTQNIPKCLLKLNDTISILDYQILTLTKIAGLSYKDIYIIGGHKFDAIKYLESKEINIIFNPKYNNWNNVYSFYLIKENIDDSFYLLNGDVVYHPIILKNLVKKDNNTFFVVDSKNEFSGEEMKVLIKKGRIVKFGKNISQEEASGEYIGLAKFNKDDAKVIFKKIEKLISKGKVDIWYELAINEVLDKIIARPIYTGGLPWVEIDTKSDYEKGKKIFKLIRNGYGI